MTIKWKIKVFDSSYLRRYTIQNEKSGIAEKKPISPEEIVKMDFVYCHLPIYPKISQACFLSFDLLNRREIEAICWITRKNFDTGKFTGKHHPPGITAVPYIISRISSTTGNGNPGSRRYFSWKNGQGNQEDICRI
jgi:hypothetical protein